MEATILDNAAPTLVTDLRGICKGDHYTSLFDPLDSYEAASLHNHLINNAAAPKTKEGTEDDFNYINYNVVENINNINNINNNINHNINNNINNIDDIKNDNQFVVVVDPSTEDIVDNSKNIVLISTIRDVTNSTFVDYVLSEVDKRITITYDVMGMIIEVSRSCKHILGFDSNELLGIDGYSYIHPDDATEVRMYHSKRASEPYGITLQRQCFRHKRKDGTYCLLEIWSQGIQQNGAWSFVGFDITDTTDHILENRGLIPDQAIICRKLISNSVVDSDSHNDVTNNFVSFICHELRNPLNGIIGYTTMILDTELTKQQRDYAEAISSISNHMCNILNQSLDLCQTQSHGTYISEIGPLRLSEVVEFCFLTVTVLAKNKGTELRLKDNLTFLQKILNNNQNNGSGSVTVILEIDEDKLPDGKDGFMAKCSVEDTGPGIPQKNLKRLFLPYSKLVSSFGLGLCICKELADKMGGKVGVESMVGNGSKFWFTFPIYTSMPEDLDDENDSGINGIFKRRRIPTSDNITSIRSLSTISSGLSSVGNDINKFGCSRKRKKPTKVLMVDDNEVNQQIAMKYLEKMGEEVTIAANGVEALEKMKNKSFDILFVDLQMPYMDGYTLARLIREAERRLSQCDSNRCSSSRTISSGQSTQTDLPSIREHTNIITIISLSPPVACTGSVLDKEKDKCRQYGMDGFLTKPYRMEEMRLCIEELVGIDDDDNNHVQTNHEDNRDGKLCLAI
ncbi:260_t:CDS:10 [Diversispora eburnea]|uniref:histidine kinase n=1 Tax=Diversispora eburnea TaxID=1213867 RepID=A0A9N9FUY8_9GLOM|nr:260_t:CDS:10 [Diversispora eburnea]